MRLGNFQPLAHGFATAPVRRYSGPQARPTRHVVPMTDEPQIYSYDQRTRQADQRTRQAIIEWGHAVLIWMIILALAMMIVTLFVHRVTSQCWCL